MSRLSRMSLSSLPPCRRRCEPIDELCCGSILCGGINVGTPTPNSTRVVVRFVAVGCAPSGFFPPFGPHHRMTRAVARQLRDHWAHAPFELRFGNFPLSL